MSSAPRTVDDYAAPYVNFLVRVPAAGLRVCRVCHSIVGSNYPMCYPCNEEAWALGESRADLAAFVSMAPVGEQFAHELYAYKNPAVGERDRQRMTVGLGAVLWKWLAAHERCMAARLGVQQFDVITTIPSTSGRASHPLRTVVAGIVVGSDKRHADLLTVARTDLEQRAQAADRYRATRSLTGASVLVVDDTWTTGAHAQSASAALKAAGARSVAALAIGRWFKPSWNTGDATGVSWLAEHRKPGWSWERCCLDPDAS